MEAVVQAELNMLKDIIIKMVPVEQILGNPGLEKYACGYCRQQAG
jgi:hypothetical protein